MIDSRLEHFLLNTLADDWIPFGEFLMYARRVTPDDADPERVAEIIRELAERGLIILGSWGESGRWEPWDSSIDEGMQRIAEGFNGEAGYRRATEQELGSTEVFRADLTPAGQAILRALGDPFELYGDPWDKTRQLSGVRELPSWQE